MLQNLKVISNFVRNGHCESFAERFPFIRVMTEENFFLECDAYDLIIPCFEQEQSEIHLLEKVVLKLIQLNPECTDKEISEKLCIEDANGSVSLIRMIRARLQSLEMLDTNNELTASGLEQIAGSIGRISGKQKRQIAQVFVIRQLNYMLPFIHIREIESEYTERTDSRHLSMTIGSAGKERVINGSYFWIPKKFTKSSAPKKRDVIDIINRYNKLARDITGHSILDYDQNYAIDISPQPSRVVLHMKAVLQAGNVDHPLISDGFSCDITCLSNYIMQETRIINQMMEHNICSSDSEEHAKNGKAKKPHEFSRLYTALRKAEQTGDGTLDAADVTDASNKKYLLNHYFALEWAIHYHLLRNLIPEASMSLFCTQSKTENMRTAIAAARKLGLKIPKGAVILSGADQFTLQTWQTNGIPVLKVLLPMAIVVAEERDEDNFRTLAFKMPELLVFLQILHSHANALRHGAEEDLSHIPIQQWAETVRRIIHILLPAFQFENESDPNYVVCRDASQERLDAQVSVAQVLGWDMVRSMSANNKQLLMSIAPCYDNNEQKQLSPNDFILTLSQIIENVMADELLMLTEIDTTLTKEQALTRIEQRIGRKVSEGIYYTATYYYQDALHQKRTTLNGMFIVYMAFADSKRIDAVAKDELDDFISKLSILRGHGNDVNLSLRNEELHKLRCKMFDLLKMIGG